MLSYDEIMAMWNVQADAFNQWDNLCEIEKVEFAFKQGYRSANDADLSTASTLTGTDKDDLHICHACDGTGYVG